MKWGSYVLLAGLLTGASAYAQLPDLKADEVVVTATRFEEKASEQPVNVQVITAEQIKQSGARTLPELLAQQAGIFTRNSSGNPNRQIDIRGFGSFGDQNSLILIDGQRISENEQTPANLTGIALSSIDRIEIVRGSGGAVLYGTGATGGAINIVTRSPRPQEKQAYLKGAAGNYGTTELGAGGTLAGDRLGLTVDTDKYDSNNYRDNNAVTQKNVNIGAHYFGDRGPVALKYFHSEQELGLPSYRTEAQLATNPRGTLTPDDTSSLDSDRVLLTTTQTYAFGQLGLDAGYRERHSVSQFVSSGGFTDTLGRVSNISPRLKLPFQLFGRSNALVVGVDWDDWEYHSTTGFPVFNFFGTTLSSQENRSAYFKDTLEVTDRTILSIGGRTQRSESTFEVVGGATPTQEQNKTLSAFDVAIRQGLTDEWAVYARTGRSFRVANVDDNLGRTTLLEPQTANDQEIGTDFTMTRASFHAAVYRVHLQNEIFFLPALYFPTFGANTNLPPTERKGFELDGNLIVSDTVSISANYTYTIAKFREGSFNGADVSGHTVPLVPKHRANGMITWKPSSQVSLSGRVTYVGEQYFDNDESNSFGRKMPSYTVSDLIAAYDVGNWRFGATIYNLFNEKYFSYGILNAPSFVAYPEAERSYMVSAEYRFGK
jgi:iron complex outermembrane recepter protein